MDVMETSWIPFYEKCITWGETWKETRNGDVEWPPDVKVFDDKMYFEERLCIPIDLQKPWIRLHHSQLAHVGADRLLTYFSTGVKVANLLEPANSRQV